MSVNAATIKSITANLITILSALGKFTFESDKISPEINTWVQVNIGDDEEETNHGEGPMYINQTFEIVAQRQIKDKIDHRSSGSEIKWDIKEAITVAALNVGDLASSILVLRVDQDSNINQYSSAQELIVTVNVTVRFRDLRS